MLKFRKAEKKDKDNLCSLMNSTPGGAVAFSALCLSSQDISDSFFVGEDENGETASVVFDTGNEYFLVCGEEFPELFPRAEKVVMIYKKNECTGGTAELLQGKEILDLYKLLSGKNTLSFDDERRYVIRLRGVNSGYAAVFGIKKDGRLVSSASVSSMNEGYAVIADVYTAEEHRNKGLGGDCIMSAVNFSLKKGKIPMLLCDEKMCPYYEKAGFEIYGKM